METKEIKFEIPEGYELDTALTDLSKGIIKLKKKENQLPQSWEELEMIKGYFIEGGSSIINFEGTSTSINRNIFPTKELAEAALALAQLLQLRDRYNDRWVPDWNNGYELKYTIYVYDNKLICDENISANHVLYFKSEKLRDEFLSAPEINKLLQIAKSLL